MSFDFVKRRQKEQKWLTHESAACSYIFSHLLMLFRTLSRLESEISACIILHLLFSQRYITTISIWFVESRRIQVRSSSF